MPCDYARYFQMLPMHNIGHCFAPVYHLVYICCSIAADSSVSVPDLWTSSPKKTRGGVDRCPRGIVVASKLRCTGSRPLVDDPERFQGDNLARPTLRKSGIGVRRRACGGAENPIG